MTVRLTLKAEAAILKATAGNLRVVADGLSQIQYLRDNPDEQEYLRQLVYLMLTQVNAVARRLETW